jgi:peptide deformylase
MPAQLLVQKKKVKFPPLTIYKLGDRVLRQPAKRVAKIDDDLRKLVRDMLVTMYSQDGVGLAAPQVGINKQLLVIDSDPEDPKLPQLVLVNPTIQSFGPTLCSDQEGCLSIPGVYLDVKRPEEVVVSYKDENGRPKTLKADGFLARVIQHEMDHLNGVMFVDRVDNKIALTQELSKNGFSTQAVQPLTV